MKKIILSILLSSLWIYTLYICLNIFNESNNYFTNLKIIKEKQTIEYKLKNHFIENKIKKEFETTYEKYKNKTIKEQKEEILKKIHIIKIIYIFSILITILTFFDKKNTYFKIIYTYTISIAVILLTMGITLPIITIEVFKNLQFFDYTILKFDIKSIIDSFFTLINKGNYIIPILLFLFSIILPIIKIIILYLKIFKKKNNKLFTLTEKINKWSMADVFVVSIFIAIFALNTDELTKANYEIGIYFYAGYVLLSLIITELLILKKKINFF